MNAIRRESRNAIGCASARSSGHNSTRVSEAGAGETTAWARKMSELESIHGEIAPKILSRRLAIGEEADALETEFELTFRTSEKRTGRE